MNRNFPARGSRTSRESEQRPTTPEYPEAFDVNQNTRELALHVFRQVQAVTCEECARICDKNGDAKSAAEIRVLPMQQDLWS
jgi:hypothetical protein